MSVLIGQAGGTVGTDAAETFLPVGTQVRIFSDTFNRPNALTLGRQWANWWLVTDEWTVNREADLDDRPEPFNCAINPSIAGNQCVFWTRASGVGWTACAPLPLAWIGQEFVDQFCECDVTQIAPYDDPAAGVGIWIMVCYTCNPGSPEPSSGGYLLGCAVGPSGIIGGAALLRIQFGFNPSATFPLPNGGMAYYHLPFPQGREIPSRSPEIAGIRAPRIASPLPIHLRLEARHLTNAWSLTGFFNGENLGTFLDSNVGAGIPGLVCDQMPFSTTDLNHLATVDNFRAGAL